MGNELLITSGPKGRITRSLVCVASAVINDSSLFIPFHLSAPNQTCSLGQNWSFPSISLLMSTALNKCRYFKSESSLFTPLETEWIPSTLFGPITISTPKSSNCFETWMEYGFSLARISPASALSQQPKFVLELALLYFAILPFSILPSAEESCRYTTPLTYSSWPVLSGADMVHPTASYLYHNKNEEQLEEFVLYSSRENITFQMPTLSKVATFSKS